MLLSSFGAEFFSHSLSEIKGHERSLRFSEYVTRDCHPKSSRSYLENSPYVNSIFILKHATPAVDMSSNKCNFFYFKDSRNVISSICNKVLLMPFRRLVTRIQWNNSAAVRKCSFSAIGIFLLHVIEYINSAILTYLCIT